MYKIKEKIKKLERDREILANASVQKWQTIKEKKRLWKCNEEIDRELFVLNNLNPN